MTRNLPFMTAARLVVAGLLLLASSGPAWAQFGLGGGGQNASAELFARVEGDTVRLAIPIEIEAGWHLYHEHTGPEDAVGLPTVVTIDASGATFGAVRFPEPQRYEQRGLGEGGRDTWILGHGGSIVLWAQGTIVDPDAFELDSLTVEIHGQVCKEACLRLELSLEVEGPGDDALFAAFPGDLSADPTPADGAVVRPLAAVSGPRADLDYAAVTFPEMRPREGVDGDTAGVGGRGLFVWLAFALLAGAILNVMPCVLPVISIKVLSFVQQAGEDKRRILHLGLAFAAGILVVFWALAAVAIGLGYSWGQQFQSEAFLVTMIGIVFALALSLFGLFELGVPAGVGTLAGMRREGLGDAFFKGMLATLLATPCSGPFLGSTLTWTITQPALVVVAVFTALGVGMAVPYVILTAQPALLKRLPRPGPWMDTFKQSMAFVLLATVLYLMVSLRQDRLLFVVAFLVAVALGCWWYGRFATFDKTRGRRLAHLGIALAIVAGGARLAFVDFHGLFENEPEGWVAFDPELFEQHLADGRHVFVDFTADWCPNCKVNEKFVFDSEEVRAVMAARGVVAMKADMTHRSPYTAMVDRLLRQLGGVSIPFAAVFPADSPTEPIVQRDLVTKDEMIRVFQSLATP